MIPVQVQNYICESCFQQFSRQAPCDPPRQGNIYGFDEDGQQFVYRGGEPQLPQCPCGGRLVLGKREWVEVDVAAPLQATNSPHEIGDTHEFRFVVVEGVETQYQPQDRFMWDRMVDSHGYGGPQLHPWSSSRP